MTASESTLTAPAWPDELKLHREWLERLVASRVGSAEAVQDVFQEICLAVVKSDRRPESLDAVAPWLCRIALRQSAMYLRTKGRKHRMLQDYAENHAAPQVSEHDPIHWLLHQEREALLREAIGGLSNELRLILQAKYFERLTYEQMAQRFGLSTHAVEYRLVEAKRQLRAALANLE